ncbi:MAG: RNA polymerase sigma factor [Actinomycetota bacterium]
MEGRPLDEDELIKLAKEGDERAYEQLVVRHQQIAVRTAYLIAGSDAEDAAQEAFMKAFYALKRFRQGAPFRPWLLRIVANEALNRRKSAKRRTELDQRILRDRPSGDAAPSPEEAVMAHEFQRELLEALYRLKERDRLLIGYRYLLEMSETEVSVVMGIPKGTVKSRLSRGLARLRNQLDEPSEEGGGYA